MYRYVFFLNLALFFLASSRDPRKSNLETVIGVIVFYYNPSRVFLLRSRLVGSKRNSSGIYKDGEISTGCCHIMSNAKIRSTLGTLTSISFF